MTKKQSAPTAAPKTAKHLRTEQNRARRIARDNRRKARDATSSPRVPRGTARSLRRRDMASFNAAREARLQRFTGTILVNAPSLDMVGKHIAKVSA